MQEEGGERDLKSSFYGQYDKNSISRVHRRQRAIYLAGSCLMYPFKRRL